VGLSLKTWTVLSERNLTGNVLTDAKKMYKQHAHGMSDLGGLDKMNKTHVSRHLDCEIVRYRE